MLALIAATVSYLHVDLLVVSHGSPGMGGGADAVLGGRNDRGDLICPVRWPRGDRGPGTPGRSDDLRVEEPGCYGGEGAADDLGADAHIVRQGIHSG